MICSQCNKEFVRTSNAQKCCSKECSLNRRDEYVRVFMRTRLRLFRQTEEGKQAVKNYNNSEKGKRARKKYAQSDKGKAYVKKYYQSDKVKEKIRLYRQTEKFKEWEKNYKQSEHGKKIIKKAKDKYAKTIKGKEAIFNTYKKRKDKGLVSEWRKVYEKERLKTDPIFKISVMVRKRINIFLKQKNIKKTNKSFEMIGCSPEYLKKYLENKFKPGMSWSNHGIHGWHIDHIIPLASAKNQEDFEKLTHYTNLQPLWSKENLSKKDKL